MSLFGTSLRYGTVAQAFHWLTAGLVAAAWLTASHEAGTLHETLGFAVFVVVALRLVWRFADRRPRHELSPLTTVSSHLVHGLLYLLLFAIPATAIAGSWIEGHAVTVYGLGMLGPYFTVSRQLGHEIMEFHQLLGTGIIWLAGLHAAAALFHHYFRRDGVLRAMLPGASA